MEIADIVDLVERNRSEANRLISQVTGEKAIGSEDQLVLSNLNEQLASGLSLTFLEGNNLLTVGGLKDVFELLVLYEKPKSHAEALQKMQYLIEEDRFGQKHFKVKEKAIETIARGTGLVEPDVSEIYRQHYSEKRPADAEDELADLRQEANTYARAAETIFNFIISDIHYYSEGGENFQRALHTLIIRGGDCDDIAILAGSLLRSLNYSTYLQLLPGHVFTGVVLLADVKPIAVEKLSQLAPNGKCLTNTVTAPFSQGSSR